MPANIKYGLVTLIYVHTHNMDIYIYTYIYIYMCVYAGEYVYKSTCIHALINTSLVILAAPVSELCFREQGLLETIRDDRLNLLDRFPRVCPA